jgi:hypothetical protein
LASRATDVRSVRVDGVDVTGAVVARGDSLAVPGPDGAAIDIAVHGEDGPLLVTTVGEDTERVDVLNSTGGVLTPTGHGADRGYLEVDRGQYDDALDVFAVCGAAAAFRTELGRAAGWFDPWLFAYYEDLDLSWRLRRAGWAVRYVPAARVRHRHAATSRIGSDVFLFHNRRNRLAVLTRNASLHELVGIARAVRRPREPLTADLLVPAEPAPAGPVRPRRAALAAYLRRLPRLLADRRTTVPGPTAVERVPGS